MMDRMDDLIAFLRARLDDDAATARAANPGPWRYDPSKHHRLPGTAQFEEAVFAGSTGAEATCVAATGETDDQQSMQDAAHIARHDPARVLAEVDAKQRIVGEYADVAHNDSGDSWDPDARYASALSYTVQLLALPYADHPDYQDSWRP